MTDFKKTVIKTFPKLGDIKSRDALYWKNLEFPVTRKGSGAVTHIDFCPIEPYHYAVTNSVKVEIFSCNTHQIIKTLTKFKEQALSGCFRSDGKLLVAGSAEGSVKLFDVSGKSLLRSFKGHERPVHVTRFTSDNLHVVSGGDDNVVRLYNIAGQTELLAYKEHKDYIRSGSVSATSKDIFITGAYDHKVKLYDARTAESVLTVDHGCPVESVLMHPQGSLFYSAGGEVIKVWDALAGGRLIASFSNHHKTITCLTFCSDNKRLVSGGLDRHVKIYDMATYEVVHTLDYTSAILSVGVAKDDSLISVGTVDGYLITQRRREEVELIQEEKQKHRKKVSYKYAIRTHVPQKDDHVILREKQERLAMYDKYFRNFNYSKAFDSAIGMGIQNPEKSISIIQELIRRGGLRRALAGRNEKNVALIMKFLLRYVTDAKYTNTIIDLTNMVLEIHKEKFNGQSRLLLSKMRILKSIIDKEMNYLKQSNEVMGMLDTILTASQTTDLKRKSEISEDLKHIILPVYVTPGKDDTASSSLLHKDKNPTQSNDDVQMTEEQEMDTDSSGSSSNEDEDNESNSS